MKKLLFLILLLLAAAGSAAAQDIRLAEDTQQSVCPVCVDLFGNPIKEGCMIKGNVNSKGERIYHCPLWRDYQKTDIDESRGERWFCTEDEARTAGWRKPKYKTGLCR